MKLDTPVAADNTELGSRLLAARSVKEACEAVVAYLGSQGPLLPSLYLERGGRLRCQAVSGYWQIFDGMPPEAGVIGRTFATGEPTMLPEISRSDDYLEAVAEVCSEACVPVFVDGRPVGAINVESVEPLDHEIIPLLTDCAAALTRRIDALGGLTSETRPERLARHAAGLAGLRSARAVLERGLAAACDVSEMESALIALDGPTGLEVAAASGPHAPTLCDLSSEELERIGDWVSSATSTFTIGGAGGLRFTGHEPLRAAGVEAAVVLSFVGTDGFMMLVDSAPHALETDDIGLLELLAAHVSSALSTAQALDDLQVRADTDPLTGLGHHASFHAALEELTAGPERRGTLALLVADVDGFKNVNDTRGHQAGDEVLRHVADALRATLRTGDVLARVGGDEFAALVTLPTPEDAYATADRVRLAVGRHSGTTASVGVAVRTPGEPAARLVARADSALYQAKREGRDRTVESSRLAHSG